LFTNDYIMRMIEQLVLGIALIMGLKKEHKTEEATVLLTGTLRKFFGLNDSAVEELSWDSLMSVVSLGGAPDPERSALLAQLIKDKADLSRMQGGLAAAKELYIKALNILLASVLQDDRLVSGTNIQYIDEIVATLAGQELPEESAQLLERYRKALGS